MQHNSTPLNSSVRAPYYRYAPNRAALPFKKQTNDNAAINKHLHPEHSNNYGSPVNKG